MLDREWRRNARSQQPLTLLLFDLDRFKQFNDSYGHQAGDHVLAAIAKAARACADRKGLIARADQALYRAKHQGRDQIVTFSPDRPASNACA